MSEESNAKRSKTSAELSASEATQYDRQIRLWGLDAQRRIRDADVLVIGASGVAAELCKNVVLAGIHSLTLLDHRQVTLEALSAQFLIGPDQLGENVSLRFVVCCFRSQFTLRCCCEHTWDTPAPNFCVLHFCVCFIARAQAAPSNSRIGPAYPQHTYPIKSFL
jgi:hypothetical protein